MSTLRPAALAFDSIAADFDSRFGEWRSVAAQRSAVRAVLMRGFPAGGRILELGGGTGEDAAFLAQRGFEVLMTDASPAMVSRAQTKLAPLGAHAEVCSAEEIERLASRAAADTSLFDGAFSNFAPLNCVTDLALVAQGLARLLKPGAMAMLVLFGTCCPGEIASEVLRGRPRSALRRFRHGESPARLADRHFRIVYHRSAALKRTFAPWFVLEKRYGIGIAVPPSAAEPWITHQPRLLSMMERFDKLASRPFAFLGDHILYQFRRNDFPGRRDQSEQ